MSTDAKIGCGIAVGIAVFFAAIFAIAYAAQSYGCTAQFADSNIESRYGFLTGCQVKDPRMGWIPAENYRVF